MKRKVLVVVAHPDDETIWMGGTLLSNKKQWDTTIISLCRKNDKDRSPKFKKVCRILKAKSFMSTLEDRKLNEISTRNVVNKIKKLSNKSYDYIFTHGRNGEYGHIRHKDVNKAITEMVKNKMLSCKKIFFFSYVKKGKLSYPNKNSDKFIKLKTNYIKKKKDLIQNVYGFGKKSFEDCCCRGTEAFRVKEIT